MSSTFCVMLHTHRGGCAQHSHHLGLVSLNPTESTLPPTNDIRKCVHAHIIFMGVELWTLSTHNLPDPESTEGGAFQLDVGLPCVGDDSTTTGPLPSVLSALPPVIPTGFVVPNPADSRVSTTHRFRQFQPICAKAALACAGVARI